MNINYSQIYYEELEESIKYSADLPGHFNDLSPEQQRLFEALIDSGYRRALDDALDPQLLEETSAFSQEMSEQLSQFASFLDQFLKR